MIPIHEITGLVLAGGQGRRMGGADKGLQLHRGVPLAMHALRRLSSQVGGLMINANRNLETYRSMGVPVWPDTLPDHPGPLAGFLCGMQHCHTPYLVTVPCDSPRFPLDLVRRLATGLNDTQADLALAATAQGPQPVFCLMKTTLRDSLQAFLNGGCGKVDRWATRVGGVSVVFEAEAAFANANTAQELQDLDDHD